MPAAVLAPHSGAQRRQRPARAGSRSKETSLPRPRREELRGERVGERNAAQLRELVEPNKWQRMDWLRVHSARLGQRLCGLTAAVDEVTVQRSNDGKVHFGGLMTCNSRQCPSCGPRIAAQTRTEIERAIAAWMIAPTRKLLFGTFTIRHRRGQPFAELAAAVSAAWAAATGGRGWVNDRMQHGIEHTIRIFEQKLGIDNGWHIHVHVLFFVDERLSAAEDHTGLLSTMFKRWARSAVDSGMGVPLLRAQDLHEVESSAALDRIADYFAKETTDAEGPRSIAAEMSNAAGKQGLTSLTPGQLLAWAIDGEPYVAQLLGAPRRGQPRGLSGQEYAKMLYAEFELGMKGRRTIAWSHGMRDALGLGAEPTDQELVERQEALDAKTEQTLVSMDGLGWRKLNARPGRRAQLYLLAATSTPGELVEWLSGFGVESIPRRRDRDLDSPGGPWFTELPTPF